MMFNSEDKVNIIVAFYDDDDIITKENCFFREDVNIKRHDRKYFCTERIKDINPKNFSSYIPIIIGYSFLYPDGYDTPQFNAPYNAYVLMSKDPMSNMKKKFSEFLISDNNK